MCNTFKINGKVPIRDGGGDSDHCLTRTLQAFPLITGECMFETKPGSKNTKSNQFTGKITKES
jgi:hypothetical protein